MKHLLYITLALVMCTFTACQKDKKEQVAKIHGKIGTTYKVRYLEDQTAGLDYTSKGKIPLKVDKEGYFNITINLEKPTYYKLASNTIYLSPGDDLDVFIANKPQDAKFTGTGLEANKYLAEFANYNAGNMRGYDSLLVTEKRRTTLSKKKLEDLKNVSKEFKELETARIDAKKAETYSFFIKFEPKDKRGTAKQIDSLTNEVIKSLNAINKAKFLDISTIRSLISFIKDDSTYNQKIKFNESFLEYVDFTEKARKVANCNKETLDSLKSFSKTLKVESLQYSLNYLISKRAPLLKGAPAIDIELEDINGKKVNLSDYKGKYIYLDFWATWCGPCKQQAPFFEKLNQEIDNDDILFISVSVDSSIKAWKEYLAKHDKKTLQLHSTDKAIYNDWQVKGIPHFILIDKDFNIIKSDAPRPSTKEAKEMLSKLE